MHVADGLLPAPLCIGGYALGGLTLWWTLRQSKAQTTAQSRAREKARVSRALGQDTSSQSSAPSTALGDHPKRAPGELHPHPNGPSSTSPVSTPVPPTAPPTAQQNIARAALLTAAFFVASSIRIAIPPTSVHFVLVGLMGAILGPLAFPSVVVGLTLQAVLVGHGGLTVLGVNSLILGWPAVVAGLLFRLCHRWGSSWLGRSRSTLAGGFLAGSIGTALAVGLFFGAVLMGITPDLNPEVEQAATVGIAIAHAPLVLIEGCFTAAVIGFCQRVYPDLLPDFLPVSDPRNLSENMGRSFTDSKT
ncbi:MAG: CbiM family transporter, partial [Cyanobacteria bacterium P01_F01_bin.153]